ncbi:2329_t:CDS:2, partial [Gigaspora margarita]
MEHILPIWVSQNHDKKEQEGRNHEVLPYIAPRALPKTTRQPQEHSTKRSSVLKCQVQGATKPNEEDKT